MAQRMQSWEVMFFFFLKPVPSPNELITVNTKKNPTLEVLPWDADEKLGGILILDSLKKTSKGRHPQPSVSFFLCGRRIVWNPVLCQDSLFHEWSLWTNQNYFALGSIDLSPTCWSFLGLKFKTLRGSGVQFYSPLCDIWMVFESKGIRIFQNFTTETSHLRKGWILSNVEVQDT